MLFLISSLQGMANWIIQFFKFIRELPSRLRATWWLRRARKAERMASNPKIKRPKSDGRCVHCGKNPEKLTKDHVFPDSWYPESTPRTVQHWTVPACLPCNGELGLVEKEVFVRLGLCVNPQKVAATGISKRVIRSLGIGAEGLDEDEKRIRSALK